MRSGGHPDNRNRQAVPVQVSADDPLPTAAVILAAKRQAATACADLASAVAWPDLDAAKAWIDQIPLVALAALAELCPSVAIGRLARCVGLDPLDGPDMLAARRSTTLWPALAEVVARVVQACGAGR